jgi:hypothetical protein
MHLGSSVLTPVKGLATASAVEKKKELKRTTTEGPHNLVADGFVACWHLPCSNEAMEGVHLFHEMPKSTAETHLGPQDTGTKTKEASVATSGNAKKSIVGLLGVHFSSFLVLIPGLMAAKPGVVALSWFLCSDVFFPLHPLCKCLRHSRDRYKVVFQGLACTEYLLVVGSQPVLSVSYRVRDGGKNRTKQKWCMEGSVLVCWHI